MGEVLSQADVDPARNMACDCGGVLQYQRRRCAKVLRVFGWVEYQCAYYAGCDCGRGKAPLDEKLGLAPGQVTAGLATLLGMAGVELAFDYSSSWLEPFLLFAVSENTIRKETQPSVNCKSHGKRRSLSRATIQLICRNAYVRRPNRRRGYTARWTVHMCASKSANSVRKLRIPLKAGKISLWTPKNRRPRKTNGVR